MEDLSRERLKVIEAVLADLPGEAACEGPSKTLWRHGQGPDVRIVKGTVSFPRVQWMRRRVAT